jgi:outer membrane protein
MSKLFGTAVLAVAALVAAGTAQAQGNDKGNWLVRARALHLDSANGDDTGLKLSINNRTFAEVDISYFFAPNWAAELVLTYPQKHTLYSNGTEIGSLKHLPPTLLGQYHFTGLGAVRPYLGAGVNYTNFSSVHFDPAVNAALHPNVKRNSWGAALQAGVDVAVGNGWVVNVDVKKVQIRTDVLSSGTKVGTFKVDPVLFSVGAGLRF